MENRFEGLKAIRRLKLKQLALSQECDHTRRVMVIRIGITVPMIFTFIIPVLVDMSMFTPGGRRGVIPVAAAKAIV